MTPRHEHDSLGEKLIPADALWGIHTARAMENFPVTGRLIAPELIHAFGQVKLAAARTNKKLGYLSPDLADLIEHAAIEMAEGKLDEYIRVDPFQGGAGTSTNLNVCEVLANRALILAGKHPGDYNVIDPLEHVNLHQSTNDTYPTALKIATYELLKSLESAITEIQETCQTKEQELTDVLKVGRTELTDAVPMTLGRSFGAWADAFARDRWRIYKCTERIRVVNLGGTPSAQAWAPHEIISSMSPKNSGPSPICPSHAPKTFSTPHKTWMSSSKSQASSRPTRPTS